MFISYRNRTQLIRYPFDLIMSEEQERRLSGTCFRPEMRCAGNFMHWRSMQGLLKDRHMEIELITEIQQALADDIREGTEGDWEFTIPHTMPVGWISTAPISKLPLGVVTKPFRPNKYTTALTINDPTVLSPRTELTTFICSVKRVGKNKPGVGAVIIRSCYPGDPVELGERHNPRTIEPKEAVFFPWSQPGA